MARGSRGQSRKRSYPSVHPDPSHAQPLYDAALVLKGLDPDAQQILMTLNQDYLRVHDELSERMDEAVYERYWTTYAGRSSRLGTFEDLWALLKEIGIERERLNQEQVDVIQSDLPAELHATLPEWDFDANPRSRPWDREYQHEYLRARRAQVESKLRDPNLAADERAALQRELENWNDR